MSSVELPELLLDLLRLAFLLALPVVVRWLATARRTRRAAASRPAAPAPEGTSALSSDTSVAPSVR